MKLYFKHKETGYKISMDEIKEKIDKMLLLKYFDKEYRFKEIPFNDDWEAIEIENDFTTEELYIMLYALINSNDKELYNKVKKKIHEFIKMSW